MTTSKYRYIVPNGITFASLICGLLSIIFSATGTLAWAGILILSSYILDLFDGALARRLKAGSDFGLQLDSLVDMVSLGVAPATLGFIYMQSNGVPAGWGLFAVLLLVTAGAFRLARFNLLPPKADGSGDSVGLTISTGGASVALAVLSNLASNLFPAWVFVPFIVVIAILMASMISFPSFVGLFGTKRQNVMLMSALGVSLIPMSYTPAPFFNTWFFWTNVYLGFSVVREGWRRSRH